MKMMMKMMVNHTRIRKSETPLFTLLALFAPTLVAAQLSPLALREDYAKVDGTRVELRAEPEEHRIIAPPALMLHRDMRPPAAMAPMALQVKSRTRSAEPAELEATAIYESEVPYVMPRRVVRGGGGDNMVYWELPKSDQVTSITLTARGGDVEVLGSYLLPLDTLELPDRIAAFSQNPLRPLSAGQPVRNGLVGLQFAFPEDVRTLLSQMDLELKISADGRTPVRERVAISLERKQDEYAGEMWTVRMPGQTLETLHVSLVEADSVVEKVLAQVMLEVSPPTGPYFDLPLRSIEDFAVAERNGELVLYACVGDVGARRGEANVPLPTELVWVAAGNGAEWPLFEPALRTRRDVLTMNGGPISFSVLVQAREVYSLFTTAYSNGQEALNLANAINSLKVTPIASNPIWEPESAPLQSPAIRGNALFPLNDSRLVVSLVKKPGEATGTRAMVSNMRSRWNDLGPVPLPDLDENALTLSGLFKDSEYYLLAGPEPQLYKATHPLRDWKPVPITAPAGWENLHLVQWNGETWLFGLLWRNGCGVITWAPVDRDGEGFKYREKFEFHPPSLVKAPPPTPRQERAETHVR